MAEGDVDHSIGAADFLPSNLPAHPEIVTGVNLPMMVKVPNVQQGSGSLREAADRLRDLGQRAIQLATHYLEKPHGGSS